MTKPPPKEGCKCPEWYIVHRDGTLKRTQYRDTPNSWYVLIQVPPNQSDRLHFRHCPWCGSKLDN